MEYRTVEPSLNLISGKIIDAAYHVHSHLGPGLLESIYHRCLEIELRERGLRFESEVAIPIRYKHHDIDGHMRIDLLVEDQIIVELKSVDAVLPVHRAQIITYLKLTGKRIGLLLNFNVDLMKHGINRIIV